MRLFTWLIGTSCLLLTALFIALFAIAHQAEAADDLLKGKTVAISVGHGMHALASLPARNN